MLSRFSVLYFSFSILFTLVSILNSTSNLSKVNSLSVSCWNEAKSMRESCSQTHGCDIYGRGCAIPEDSLPEGAVIFSGAFQSESLYSKVLQDIVDYKMFADDSFHNDPHYINRVEKNKISRKNLIQRKLKNLFFMRCESLLSDYVDLITSSKEDAYDIILKTPQLIENNACIHTFLEIIDENLEINDLEKDYKLSYRINSIISGYDSRTILIDDYFNYNLEQYKRIKQPRNKKLIGDKPDLNYMSSIFLYMEDDMSKYNKLDISLLPGNYSILEKYKNNFDLTLVRDQSECGSCWAFSTAEVFSDRRTIHALSHGDHSWDKSVASAWDVASCSHYSLGCDGGNPIFGIHYGKVYGIVSGGPYEYKNTGHSCQPYQIWPCRNNPNLTPHQADFCKNPNNFKTTCSHKCLDPLFKKSYIQDKSFSKSYPLVYDSHVRRVLHDIFSYGSVSVAFKVFTDFESWNWNNWPVYYHRSGSLLGGHAVKVVGYGFDSKTKIAYWLVVNSWSNKWGIKGTFKIHRSDIDVRSEPVQQYIDEWFGWYAVSYFGNTFH